MGDSIKQQNTLFKTWGTAKCREDVIEIDDPGPSNRPSSISGDVNRKTEPPVAQVETTEEYKFEDDDFLDDDATEALLLQASVDFAYEGSHPTSSSSIPKQLKQNTIPFHIGPSASTHSILNSSVIEEEIAGFDLEAGEKLIYPTNYPVRDYQYNIVKKSLFINTLVSLPTGLGKTFIAAVVMYNYYRWYPSGKIVFLAPTKPLVAQQIEACYGVMGIPQEDMAEMTGSMSPKDRVLIWREKRVFFLTPQVMQNDLSKGTCSAKDVKCVVFDEAHKALGNYAYCQIIKALTVADCHYRVLALSATPGNDLKAVQQVVTNLLVGHIELRSEDSFDIQQYVHEKKVEKIVVALEGEILDIKNRFLKMLSRVLERLTRYGVLYHSSPERMSKYQLLHARDQFRATGPPEGVMAGAVEGDFALSISLFHAFELLLLHGMRSFHQFLKNTFSAATNQSRARKDVIRSPLFNGIMKELHEHLQESKFSPDGPAGGMGGPRFPITGCGELTTNNQPDPEFFYSHPKLKKLEEVVLEHFGALQDSSSVSSDRRTASTRVMIFSQYRESVQEIADMLSQHLPLIKVMTFVGHSTGKSNSRGLTQKEQTEIVRKFREGGYNTLVATCVGEEGLDIGEVDLIICFDAAKSPVRLVQRMGRTGRRRSGKIVVIVVEGKEDQIYTKSQSSKKSIHKAIREGCKNLNLYQRSPRMVPRHVKPQVHKMQMTVEEFVSANAEKRLKKNAKCRRKFGVDFTRSKKGEKNAFLNNQELACWSKELSLSDREFRAVEKSIHRCLSTKTPFLSLEHMKAKSGKASSLPEKSHASLESSYVYIHQKENSSMLLRDRFALSLSKWVHLQTAPASTKMIGHSSTTEVLRSSLEFLEVLQTSDGMGSAYDLEMQTFLDKKDISSNVSHAGNNNDRGKGGKNKNRKRQKRFLDSSDDEDFVVTSTHVTSTKQCSKSPSKVEEVHDKGERENACSTTVFTDGDPSVEGSIGVSKKHGVHFTASQHVVPRPPPEDEPLDWLDNIDPSQSQQHLTSTVTEPDRAGIPTTSEEDGEFNFVTPKAPPCMRRNKIFPTSCSTPTKTPLLSQESISPTKSAMGNSHRESIDIFEGLSSPDLFSDFSGSDGELKSQGSSPRSRKALHPVDSVSDSIHTPQLSDDDDDDDDDDDSYRLHPGKRKRRKVNFLESPHVEHIRLDMGGNKRGTPMASCRRRNEVRSPGNSDSSDDDDFCVPLLKRIRKVAGSKYQYERNSKTSENKRQPNPNNFIEGEAQLSGEEDSLLSNNDVEAQDNYDMEDSFINDNSVLTQYVQTQKLKRKNNPKSPEMVGEDMYRQSLISPKDKLFSRRKCDANRGRYRMVFSQRHQLLNHYMKRAGFKSTDADGGINQSRDHLSRKDKNADGESEAEEVDVAYGEEDNEELSSQSMLDHNNDEGHMISQEDTHHEAAVKSAFLSDSEKTEVATTSALECVATTSTKEMANEITKKKMADMPQTSLRTIDTSKFSDILISPSLHKGVKLIRTPPCFSLGMDDWITDIDYESGSETRKGQEKEIINDDEFVTVQDINDSFFDEDIVLSQDYH